MIRGLTGSIFERKKSSAPTARDYVQDGLIAMWDGIENAGFGLHNASATVWKDLSGNNDMNLATGGSWSDKSFVSNPSYYKTASIGHSISGILTIECVCKVNSYGSGRGVVAFDENSTYHISNGARYVVVRANGTVNFTGKGSYLSGAGIGEIATYSGVFPSSEGVDISAGYKNGIAQTLTASGGYGFGDNSPSVSPFSAYRLDGEIYSIRIYSRALTASEIAANYAVDAARFNLA